MDTSVHVLEYNMIIILINAKDYSNHPEQTCGADDHKLYVNNVVNVGYITAVQIGWSCTEVMKCVLIDQDYEPGTDAHKYRSIEKARVAKYVTSVVVGNEDSTMRNIYPASDCALVWHLEQDSTFMHAGYTPPRPRDFKAGWYYNSGEAFDGPFKSKETAEAHARYMLQEWDEYITSASTGWGQPIDY